MKTSKDNMIRIGTKYVLEGDTRQITLYKERVVKKTGILQYDPIGHFPSLTAALFRLIEIDLGEQRSVELIISRIDDLKKTIINSINEFSQNDQALKNMQLYSPRLKCRECVDFRKS